MRVIGLKWWIALEPAIVIRHCRPTHLVCVLFLIILDGCSGQYLVAIYNAYHPQKVGSDWKVLD